MAYTKTIVCLAKSRRGGNFCVAGKEVLGEGRYGEWIRPVNAQNDDVILPEDMKFDDGSGPKILDVISIPMLEHAPKHHQQENHLIDSGQLWAKQNTMNKQELPRLLDTPGELWWNGRSSQKGVNDQIPALYAHKHLSGSLLLIRPDPMTLIINVRPNPYKDKEWDVRAHFRHNRCDYKLKVTDPLAEHQYIEASKKGSLEKLAGPDNAYLCVSLGAEFNDYCYKLVATIIS